MFWLDFLILSLLVLGVILGAVTGLFRQVARVASLAASIYVSIAWHDQATAWLQTNALQASAPPLSNVAAYVLVFAGVYLVLFWLTCVVDQGIRVVQLGAINRLLGAWLGLAKMLMLLAVACFALSHVPHPQAQAWVKSSSLAPALAEGVDWVLTSLPEKRKKELDEGWLSLQEIVRRW